MFRVPWFSCPDVLVFLKEHFNMITVQRIIKNGHDTNHFSYVLYFLSNNSRCTSWGSIVQEVLHLQPFHSREAEPLMHTQRDARNFFPGSLSLVNFLIQQRDFLLVVVRGCRVSFLWWLQRQIGLLLARTSRRIDLGRVDLTDSLLLQLKMKGRSICEALISSFHIQYNVANNSFEL